MHGSLTVLILTTLVLTGCANRSLSAHQCHAGDWYTVGQHDGQQGADTSRLLAHQDACGRHGIVPNSADYRAGWRDGIARYCEPELGYDRGVNGQRIRNVCPASLSNAYRMAWEDGRVLFEARQAVSRLETAISRSEQRIDAIGRELLETASAQLNPDLSAEARVALVAEGKALLEERDRLQRTLPDLAVDLEQAYRRLEQIEGPYLVDRLQTGSGV